MFRIKLFVLVFLSAVTLVSVAQESTQRKSNISAGADLASSYLWRGFELGNGPAVQPWGELSHKGFTLGAWGSYEFSGGFKEVDLYGKYTHKDFSLLFLDMFFPGYEGLNQNFFNFKNTTTGHCSELGLSFNGNENIPFSFYGGVILYGTATDPKTGDSTLVNHSPYFEVKYLGNMGEYSHNLFIGLTPVQSTLYMTDGFGVINLGASAQKTVKVTENFSIPMKLTLATNPVLEKIYLTFVISL
jgi:hypothetical protein